MNVGYEIMAAKSVGELQEFTQQLSDATRREYAPMLLMTLTHLRIQELERRVAALEDRPYPDPS